MLTGFASGPDPVKNWILDVMLAQIWESFLDEV
jgi:hypothetical protein